MFYEGLIFCHNGVGQSDPVLKNTPLDISNQIPINFIHKRDSFIDRQIVYVQSVDYPFFDFE
jgi:hypothetical protein